MRFWVILTILVLAAAAVGGGYYWKQHAAEAGATTLPADTYVATAEKGDIVQSVSSTGQVASNLDVAIKCRASGEITKIPFDISDEVKKDQLLLQLDTKDEDVLVEQAQVKLAQDQAKLIEAQLIEHQAELDLQTSIEKADADIVSAQIKANNLAKKADRQKTLHAQNLASEEDYETAESDAAQAQNDLQSAKIVKEQIESLKVSLETKRKDVDLANEECKLDDINLTNAKTQLSYCTINAPMDGVISDIPTTIGLGTIIASATSNVSGGTTVLTLSDVSRMFVLATVDEADIGGIEKGQQVEITVDAYPGRVFSGAVVRIAVAGTTVSNVVTYQVKIEVTSKNKNLLRPQMTANVRIIEKSATDVIHVPMMAVVRKSRQSYVTIQKPDKSTEDRTVQSGINDGDNVEITSGLDGGENVLVFRNDANNKWSGNGQRRGGGPVTGMPGVGGGGRGR
jgi:HlyD family secretion protein